jgi:hypothetical protein
MSPADRAAAEQRRSVQKAEWNAEAEAAKSERKIEKASSAHATLITSARRLLKDYMLASTGQGICDQVNNIALGDLQAGTAVFEAGKREPGLTGSYSADCTYHVQGQQLRERETYWFRFTLQESSGRIEGAILRNNREGIKRGLDQTFFQPAT